jgi:hypothetical protein
MNSLRVVQANNHSEDSQLNRPYCLVVSLLLGINKAAKLILIAKRIPVGLNLSPTLCHIFVGYFEKLFIFQERKQVFRKKVMPQSNEERE